MAIEFQTKADVSASDTSPRSCTHPSGLAAGDLLVAYLQSPTNGWTVSTPSGWTLLLSVNNDGENPDLRGRVFYKIASASDVSDGSTSFTVTAGVGMLGSLLRFTGHDATTPIYASNSANSTANLSSYSFAAAITPTDTNSMLIMIGLYAQGADSIGSYAITTSNPTWTERAEVAGYLNTSSEYSRCGIATATRPEVTSTGNISFSISSTQIRASGIIFAIKPGPTASQVKPPAINSTGSFIII